MIDHLGLTVGNYPQARAFYAAALAPLGYSPVLEFSISKGEEADSVCFGCADHPEFCLTGGARTRERVHVAFRAESRSQVDAFYAAAIAAGGTDNGRPGPRPDYGPHYYAAFVIDPEGHNIEAVCEKPEIARPL